MHLFREDIAQRLLPFCKGCVVEFVGLGLHDLQIHFGDQCFIQSVYEVTFVISRKTYHWQATPLNMPVWILAGQEVTDIRLKNSKCLGFSFLSGDEIDIHTEEGPYECGTFDINKNNQKIYEIF